jgi:hypothetical protein
MPPAKRAKLTKEDESMTHKLATACKNGTLGLVDSDSDNDDDLLDPIYKLMRAWYNVNAHKRANKTINSSHPSFAKAWKLEREGLVAEDEARWDRLKAMTPDEMRKVFYGVRDVFEERVPKSKWLHQDHVLYQTKEVLKRVFFYGVNERGHEIKTLTPYRAWDARRWFDTGQLPPKADPYPLDWRDFEKP